MWYIIIPIMMGAIGIFMLSFGIWAIIYWDQYSKLLSNIKEIFDNIRL